MTRHIFFAPNSISYLMGREIADSRGLGPDECTFLCTRTFFSVDTDIESRRFPYQFNDFPRSWRIWDSRTMLHKLDGWVDQHIGEEYLVYLPHHSMPYYEMLATHRKCVGYSYLEEGTLAYYESDELIRVGRMSPSFKQMVKVIGGYGRRWHVGKGVFRAEYANTFGVCNEAFPWSERKVVLREAFNVSSSQSHSFHFLILLRPDYDSLWSKERVEAAMHTLIQHVREEEIEIVGVKAHPAKGNRSAMYQDVTRQFRECHAVDVREVDVSLLVEEFLLDPNNVVVSMGSSIDYYSKFVPGRLISMFSFSDHSPGEMNRYLDCLPRNQLETLRRVYMSPEAS